MKLLVPLLEVKNWTQGPSSVPACVIEMPLLLHFSGLLLQFFHPLSPWASRLLSLSSTCYSNLRLSQGSADPDLIFSSISWNSSHFSPHNLSTVSPSFNNKWTTLTLVVISSLSYTLKEATSWCSLLPRAWTSNSSLSFLYKSAFMALISPYCPTNSNNYIQ